MYQETNRYSEGYRGNIDIADSPIFWDQTLSMSYRCRRKRYWPTSISDPKWRDVDGDGC